MMDLADKLWAALAGLLLAGQVTSMIHMYEVKNDARAMIMAVTQVACEEAP